MTGRQWRKPAVFGRVVSSKGHIEGRYSIPMVTAGYIEALRLVLYSFSISMKMEDFQEPELSRQSKIPLFSQSRIPTTNCTQIAVCAIFQDALLLSCLILVIMWGIGSKFSTWGHRCFKRWSDEPQAMPHKFIIESRQSSDGVMSSTIFMTVRIFYFRLLAGIKLWFNFIWIKFLQKGWKKSVPFKPTQLLST